MFYSRCKKCGKTLRWLDKEEVKDKKLVAENKHKPITQEDFDMAQAGDIGKNKKTDKMNVVVIYCEGCDPKQKKTKTEEVVEV